MSVQAIETVANVCQGALPLQTITTNIRTFRSQILNQENSFLYTVMEEKNLSEVNLANSEIIFSKQIVEQSTDAVGTMVVNILSLIHI